MSAYDSQSATSIHNFQFLSHFLKYIELLHDKYHEAVFFSGVFSFIYLISSTFHH